MVYSRDVTEETSALSAGDSDETSGGETGVMSCQNVPGTVRTTMGFSRRQKR